MNRKPRIVLTSQDLERLEALLESLPANAFPGKDEFRAELDRADVVEPEQIPPTVVTMNSTVRFSIDSSGEDFCLTLVYPKDVDGAGIQFPSWHRSAARSWVSPPAMKSSGHGRVAGQSRYG